MFEKHIRSHLFHHRVPFTAYNYLTGICKVNKQNAPVLVREAVHPAVVAVHVGQLPSHVAPHAVVVPARKIDVALFC